MYRDRKRGSNAFGPSTSFFVVIDRTHSAMSEKSRFVTAATPYSSRRGVLETPRREPQEPVLDAVEIGLSPVLRPQMPHPEESDLCHDQERDIRLQAAEHPNPLPGSAPTYTSTTEPVC